MVGTFKEVSKFDFTIFFSNNNLTDCEKYELYNVLVKSIECDFFKYISALGECNNSNVDVKLETATMLSGLLCRASQVTKPLISFVAITSRFGIPRS